jgi:Na+-transporting NADH:ubiquinone oxidoreductase subunit F
MNVLAGILLLTTLTLALVALVLGARAVLVPRRAARVTVNRGTIIAAQTGERLLNVLNDNGVLVPAACAGAGTCGLCRVIVTEGAATALPTEAARLTRAELRAGMHLACQVILRGDMAVEVDEALIGAEVFTCTVSAVRALTPLIREIVLDLPEGLRPAIEAGSFVQVTAPPYELDFADYDIPAEHAAEWQGLRGLSVRSDVSVTRAYSIANRPRDTAAGRIVLNLRLALPPPSVPGAPPGVVSSWLFGLAPGDRVETSGPFGSFRARETGAEMVVIGGGVGMAPLRAIIHDQLEVRGATRPISYWYGARSAADLFYAEEFADLAARHPNFRWTVALSDPRPEDGWQGPTGFIHRHVETWLRAHPAPEECEYYLCGPPLMIRAVKAMLENAGVDEGQILVDDFGV